LVLFGITKVSPHLYKNICANKVTIYSQNHKISPFTPSVQIGGIKFLYNIIESWSHLNVIALIQVVQ